MKKNKLVILTMVLIAMLGAASKAGDFSIGAGYPYVGLKYGQDKMAAELKGAFGSGIQLYALRGYWNFLSLDSLRVFTGGEYGRAEFDTLDIKGSGWEVSTFIGIETFVSKYLSVSLDFSPMYIMLESGDKGADGIEYVVNLAVYIYPFGRSAKKAEKPKLEDIKPTIKTDKDKSSFNYTE